MADLKSLKYPSILTMTTAEGINHILQIRLSRRTPLSRPKRSSPSIAASKKKKQPKNIKVTSAAMAEELLKLIGGN